MGQAYQPNADDVTNAVKIAVDSLKENKVIQSFYDLHKEVGIPKRKNLPASENLLKNLLKKQESFADVL